MSEQVTTPQELTALAIIEASKKELEVLMERIDSPYKVGDISFTLPTGPVKPSTCDDIAKLAELVASAFNYTKNMELGYKALGITSHPLPKFQGYTPEDIQASCKLRVEVLQSKERREELEKLIEEAQEHITKEQKLANFLEKAKEKIPNINVVLGLPSA